MLVEADALATGICQVGSNRMGNPVMLVKAGALGTRGADNAEHAKLRRTGHVVRLRLRR